MNGYTGRTLRVDLTRGTISVDGTESVTVKRVLGGRGLGIQHLTGLAPVGVNPLAPENPLILATGPYTGAGVFSAFFNVTTKSPLTGLAAASHCGGKWGPGFKRSGFDAVVITGAAARPCYLVLEDGHAALKDADHLWGLGVFDTEAKLKSDHDGAEVACIGPAGENRVRFATLMNGHRAAGRGGVGAVMGSKKLKALVVKGKIGTAFFDKEKVKTISSQGGKKALEVAQAFAKFGSSIAFDFFNSKHTLPTRNFRGGHFPDASRINAQALKDTYFVKDRGCLTCPLKCGNVHQVKEGPYKLDEVEGPEYETLMSFGSNCANSNLGSILMANLLCNDLGMDTITCGNIFAWLMDLYESGIITARDLDGVSMKWGQHESIVALIPAIGARQGIGDLLAEGSYRAAARWGPQALGRVIHAKKQEYPGYESRRSFGTGFSLATSSRGACHLRAQLYVNELFAGEFQEKGFEAHIDTLIDKEHFLAVADSLLTCKFGMRNAGYTWPVLTDLYNALTGEQFKIEDLKRIGERIWTLERIYNLREGVEEDTLPARFFSEDLDDGQPGGGRIDRDRFMAARNLYYQARGWDELGRPTARKLTEFGLA
ncbi:MAG: aldehyde ferredoxin oxidoreductase family protein [Hyphomicrobiales bacterium]